MRIASLQSVNFVYPKNLKNHSQIKNQQTNQPAFKGIKGAGLGALGGLAYLGACVLIAGPLLPVTAGLAAAAAGAGALAGNGIENSFKKDKKD